MGTPLADTTGPTEVGLAPTGVFLIDETGTTTLHRKLAGARSPHVALRWTVWGARHVHAGRPTSTHRLRPPLL